MDRNGCNGFAFFSRSDYCGSLVGRVCNICVFASIVFLLFNGRTCVIVVFFHRFDFRIWWREIFVICSFFHRLLFCGLAVTHACNCCAPEVAIASLRGRSVSSLRACKFARWFWYSNRLRCCKRLVSLLVCRFASLQARELASLRVWSWCCSCMICLPARTATSLQLRVCNVLICSPAVSLRVRELVGLMLELQFIDLLAAPFACERARLRARCWCCSFWFICRAARLRARLWCCNLWICFWVASLMLVLQFLDLFARPWALEPASLRFWSWCCNLLICLLAREPASLWLRACGLDPGAAIYWSAGRAAGLRVCELAVAILVLQFFDLLAGPCGLASPRAWSATLVLQFLICLPGRAPANLRPWCCNWRICLPSHELAIANLRTCAPDPGAAIYWFTCPAVGLRACELTSLILVLEFIDLLAGLCAFEPGSPRPCEPDLGPVINEFACRCWFWCCS